MTFGERVELAGIAITVIVTCLAASGSHARAQWWAIFEVVMYAVAALGVPALAVAASTASDTVFEVLALGLMVAVPTLYIAPRLAIRIESLLGPAAERVLAVIRGASIGLFLLCGLALWAMPWWLGLAYLTVQVAALSYDSVRLEREYRAKLAASPNDPELHESLGMILGFRGMLWSVWPAVAVGIAGDAHPQFDWLSVIMIAGYLAAVYYVVQLFRSGRRFLHEAAGATAVT